MNINITTTAFLLWSLTGFPIQSPEQSGDAGRLVQQLGEFPAALPSTVRSDGSPDPIEERRRAVYGELRALGQDAMPALVRGLSDPNVQVRRNVALFLNVVIGAWSELSHPELDIEPALTALVVAVGDADARVRQLAAQAIGTLGPRAVTAVPALVQLLTDSDVGSRNSACIGLRGDRSSGQWCATGASRGIV